MTQKTNDQIVDDALDNVLQALYPKISAILDSEDTLKLVNQLPKNYDFTIKINSRFDSIKNKITGFFIAMYVDKVEHREP